MPSWIVEALVALLGLHALLKFAFFALPYAKRRAALDRSYGNKPVATTTSDAVLLMVCVVVAALVAWRGTDAVGFLAGLWLGATLIQLWFHRFHVPLTPDVAPPPVVSPLKQLSYAIQARPSRAWREMALFALLAAVPLALIVRGWL